MASNSRLPSDANYLLAFMEGLPSEDSDSNFDGYFTEDGNEDFSHTLVAGKLLFFFQIISTFFNKINKEINKTAIVKKKIIFVILHVH